jgi:hypothetical protein
LAKFAHSPFAKDYIDTVIEQFRIDNPKPPKSLIVKLIAQTEHRLIEPSNLSIIL